MKLQWLLNESEVMSSVQIGFTKLFLFLFDGNIGFNGGTMGTNFVSELVAVLSMGNAQESIPMQALVGLFDPVLLVLAMLINQLGDRGAVNSLWRLDLLVEAVNCSLKLLLALMVVIQIAVDMSMKPTETTVGILELTHGAGVCVDVVATLTPGSVV